MGKGGAFPDGGEILMHENMDRLRDQRGGGAVSGWGMLKESQEGAGSVLLKWV